MDARRFARRTAAWLGQLVFAEDELTGLAAGGNDLDGVTARTRGADDMAQILFEVATLEPKLARKPRRGAWLIRQELLELLAKHRPTRSRPCR